MVKSSSRIILIWVGLVVGLLLLAANIWGSRIPAEHVITQEISVAAPDQVVWQLMAAPSRVAEWNPIVMNTEPVQAPGGQNQWREHYRTGDKLLVTYEVAEENHQLTKTVADPDFPFQGNWKFTVVADGSTTKVLVEERLTLPNPIARLVRRVLGPSNWLKVQMKGLQDWAQKPVDSPAPQSAG